MLLRYAGWPCPDVVQGSASTLGQGHSVLYECFGSPHGCSGLS
jgi:hypothetical protein